MSDHRCCCDDIIDPPATCPAPCLMVSFSGITANTDPNCLETGGILNRSFAGANGNFIVPYVEGQGYVGTYGLSLHGEQSEGVVGENTQWTAGQLVIEIGLPTCSNGVVSDMLFLSAYAVMFADGDPQRPQATSVFNSPSVVVIDTQVPNAITLDCSHENQVHGGTAVVSQPPQCTLPPVYFFAEKCSDSSKRILVNLETSPVLGAGGCLFNDDLYIVIDEWQVGGQPVSVEWVTQSCPDPEPNIIAARCDDPSFRISVDPADISAGCLTVLYQGFSWNLTQEETNDPSVSIVCSTDPCPGVYFKAVPCGTLPDGVDVFTPFSYTIQPGMAPGEGVVRAQFDQPGPNGGVCTFTFWLQPTTIPDSLQPFYTTLQMAGSCAGTVSGRTGDCFNDQSPPIGPAFDNLLMTNSPMAKRGMISEDQLDAMGASPEQEAISLRQGGCCDPPRQI